MVAVFDAGTFLARRWEEEDGVNRYHLAGPQGGLLVEVYYDPHANTLARGRSFCRAEPLADYAGYGQLPEL